MHKIWRTTGVFRWKTASRVCRIGQEEHYMSYRKAVLTHHGLKLDFFFYCKWIWATLYGSSMDPVQLCKWWINESVVCFCQSFNMAISEGENIVLTAAEQHRHCWDITVVILLQLGKRSQLQRHIADVHSHQIVIQHQFSRSATPPPKVKPDIWEPVQMTPHPLAAFINTELSSIDQLFRLFLAWKKVRNCFLREENPKKPKKGENIGKQYKILEISKTGP